MTPQLLNFLFPTVSGDNMAAAHTSEVEAIFAPLNLGAEMMIDNRSMKNEQFLLKKLFL
jgi:hypothetical protein